MIQIVTSTNEAINSVIFTGLLVEVNLVINAKPIATVQLNNSKAKKHCRSKYTQLLIKF